GLTEPLYGVTTVNAQVNIVLNGPFTGAWIFITGRINKAADFVAWPQGGNDVIYGGLGDDFLHGGAGDDAISGAEAQAAFYNANPVTDTNPLHYDPASRKLAAYNASNPLAKINGFFLNFDATDAAGAKIADGKDRLFGDLGNDWLVGGTLNDRLFGGLGDDLMNADDNLETNGGLNDQPDVPLFADRDFAFGGGGLDVLIGNTGGDRLFDWSGEFNSYFMAYSPFGNPEVVRLISPDLVQFLLGLGRESGADQGLVESNGELGLVTQSDPLWNAQKGSPRDPQFNTHSSRDTQGGPEDDRGAALPTGGGGGGSGQGSGNGSDVTFGNIVVSQDPSNPGQMALFVGGTNSSEVIDVRQGATASFIRVVINGVSQGEYARGSGASAIGRIIVY